VKLAPQKDEAAPKPVVAAALILSETVLLSTLAENISCVKVKPVGRWRWATSGFVPVLRTYALPRAWVSFPISTPDLMSRRPYHSH
jgi:hypothetical protein